jgi:hypothetical protein
MVDFYSPEPSRTPRNRLVPQFLPSARLSTHAAQRSDERCGMSPDQATAALNDTGVELKATSKEDRSYRVFFAPNVRKFFVGVVAHDRTVDTAVTFLEQEQYEADRGKIRADDLRVAARAALTAEEFADWAPTFDWSAQRLDRKDLEIRARYRLSDGCEHEAKVPVSFPLQNDVLSGGNLAKALDVDGFMARANVDLYAALGEKAPQAISNLTALDIVYGPSVVLDMLSIGGPQLLARFQSRRVTRNSLMFVVTYAHDLKTHQVQKTRPIVPAAFLFEDMLPHLKTNPEFLTGVRDHLAKSVPAHDLLSAIASISELQISVDGRYIDLVTPPDDYAAVEIMLALP